LSEFCLKFGVFVEKLQLPSCSANICNARRSWLLLLFAGMDNNSLSGDGELQIGHSRSGVLGPLSMGSGSPSDNYNVYVYVRVFDTLHSYRVYALPPVQVEHAVPGASFRGSTDPQVYTVKVYRKPNVCRQSIMQNSLRKKIDITNPWGL